MTQTESQSNNIVTLLSEGKVAFSYRNMAGETRNALGTTRADLLPEGAANTEVVQTGQNITYYDLNVNGWRTFKIDNLDQSSVEPQS